MKNSLYITLFLFLIDITGYCQFEECERMYRSAIIFADGGQYEIALNKLAAAKICNPRQTKYDSLIITIYEDINRQKKNAIQARREAEYALMREKEAKILETKARNEAVKQKENVQKQLAINYWNNGRNARAENKLSEAV